MKNDAAKLFFRFNLISSSDSGALIFATYLFIGRKLSDGYALGGSNGGLTLLKCDTLQNVYGKSLRDNKGDVSKMTEAVWAILKHYSQDADHSDCPKCFDSWCSFNEDTATGDRTHRPIKNALRPAVVETIKPLFKRLAKPSFLANVQECYTQNPCESFNHLLWSLSPKEQ